MWQVSISTLGEVEDAVSHLLERVFLHAPSVFRDEATGAVVVTSYPKRLPTSPKALRADLTKAVATLRSYHLEPGMPRIQIKRLPRRNWAESWKRHFKPIEIGDFLLIKPGWSRRRARSGQRVIILDPGLSFGTGHHPTTLFCLERIVKCLRGEQSQSFLDVGTGSGILAIAAAKLGYAPVLGFDCDPESLRVARGNIKKNRVEQHVRLRRSDLNALRSNPAWRYDLICANLTADVLLANAENLCILLGPGGRLVIAGVLKREFPEVSAKLRRINLTLEASKVDKDWKSGQFALLSG
jgi:ribosomal protein L11 methyltransferase